MSLSKRWAPYSVKVHAKTAQSSGAVYVNGISNLAVNEQLRTGTEGGDGNVFQTFGALVDGAPGATFSTSELKAALDAVGATFMLIDTDGSHPGVVTYFRRMTQGGTRDAYNATTHWSATFPNGLLVPRRLSVRSGDTARLELEVFPRASGATAPVTYSETASLPNNTAGASTVWTIGKISLNGTTLDGIESVDIDFGVRVGNDKRDSDIYPTFNGVESQAPSVRIRSAHVDSSSFLTEDGLYLTSATALIYLRKRAEGGTFVADATAEHILFTLGKCRAEITSLSPDASEIVLTPWQDTTGPVNPIAVSTATAIS